jgi:FlaA1/EpsC-like NDP-sugar epimerase
VARALRRVRTGIVAFLLDVLVIAAAYLLVLLLRFDGSVPDSYWQAFAEYLPLLLLAHVACNWAWGLYRELWRHASVQEAQRVLVAGATAALALTPIYFALNRPVPLSVAILGALVATLAVGGIRFQPRLFAVRRRTERIDGLRVAVVGAGEAGAAIVREMKANPTEGLRPVVMLDDDPRKQGLSLLGVPVIGGIDELRDIVRQREIHRILLAIPSAAQSLVRRVSREAEAAGVPLQTIPGLQERIRGAVSLREVRDVSIEDLLGRQEIKIDLEGVGNLLSGRRVLITGGGGSIGSEIARQVAMFEPSSLTLLDHDETHLSDAALSLMAGVTALLADIRDGDRLQREFARLQPEIVFHAAAHKHVPILEQFPGEAVSTNVVGTRNVMRAAMTFGVERLVLISTDKAVRPTSVMGASKWLAEQIVIGQTPESSPYCAVRFGNVLGSRGSVVPVFARQIAAGGPVTITDPQMTRYFMSLQEAVQLVLQATVFASGREVFMLEMGEAVNILSLARHMIHLAGHRPGTDIPIEIVGARPGEKVVEELSAPMEAPSTTDHEAIVRLEPVVLPPRMLDSCVEHLVALAAEDDAGEAARTMLALANGSVHRSELFDQLVTTGVARGIG